MNETLAMILGIILAYECVFGFALTMLPLTYLSMDENRKINYIKLTFITFYYGVSESAKESKNSWNKEAAWNLTLFGKIFLIAADITLIPMRLIVIALFGIVAGVMKLCTKAFVKEAK